MTAILDDLRVAMGLPDDAGVAAEAFDQLAVAADPASEFPPAIVHGLVLSLELRREAGVLVREVGNGMVLYYPPDAADLDDDGRVYAAGEVTDRIAEDFGIGEWSGNWAMLQIVAATDTLQ